MMVQDIYFVSSVMKLDEQTGIKKLIFFLSRFPGVMKTEESSLCHQVLPSRLIISKLSFREL